MSEENETQDSNEGLQNLLKKHDSDWAALAGELYKQTGQLREKRRALDAQIQTLEGEKRDLEAKIPKDGSRVLPKAEADRYDAFLALNLKPDEIKTKLEAGSEAQQKAHRADTREALRKLGYEPTERLLKDFDGVSLVVTESEDKKLVGKVKAGDDEQPFGDWAKGQGIDSDLERYRSEPAEPDTVPALGQVGNGAKAKNDGQQHRKNRHGYKEKG